MFGEHHEIDIRFSQNRSSPCPTSRPGCPCSK